MTIRTRKDKLWLEKEFSSFATFAKISAKIALMFF